MKTIADDILVWGDGETIEEVARAMQKEEF